VSESIIARIEDRNLPRLTVAPVCKRAGTLQRFALRLKSMSYRRIDGSHKNDEIALLCAGKDLPPFHCPRILRHPLLQTPNSPNLLRGFDDNWVITDGGEATSPDRIKATFNNAAA
jgi:hypothetical protein